MAKKSKALLSLPLSAEALIQRIGRDLRISRLRRGISQDILASRMNVSKQTLQRLERGDPAVAFGIYVTCAFCLNRMNEMKDLFATANDVYGNDLENRRRMLQRKARKADDDPLEQPDF